MVRKKLIKAIAEHMITINISLHADEHLSEMKTNNVEKQTNVNVTTACTASKTLANGSFLGGDILICL